MPSAHRNGSNVLVDPFRLNWQDLAAWAAEDDSERSQNDCRKNPPRRRERSALGILRAADLGQTGRASAGSVDLKPVNETVTLNWLSL